MKPKSTSLTPEDIQEVMRLDCYYAIPLSLVKWVCSLNLKNSEQICLERLVSHTVMNKGLPVRMSLTYFESITSLSIKTISTAIIGLIKKNVISKLEVSSKGSLLSVHIPSEIKNNVKVRFAKNKVIKKRSPQQKKAPSPLVKQKHKESNGCSDFMRLLKKKESSLLELTKKINDSENLPPSQRMSAYQNVDLTQIEALEKDIYYLKNKCAKAPKVISAPLNQSKAPSEPSKKPLRAIKVSQIAQVYKKIKSSAVTLKKEVVNQVVWSIRFGWYRRKPEWTTQHCINHALLLVKKNCWSTPSDFNEGQIEGLVKYALKLSPENK